MPRLFGRTATLQITRDGDSVNVSGYRVKFRVEKFIGQAGNKAQIKVFNLPLSIRSRVARRRNHLGESVEPADTVLLQAGYPDREAIIARGVIIEAVNTKNGPDWETDILIYTALEQKANAIINKSYNDITSARQMIINLFTDAAFPFPRFSQEAENVLANKTITDFTVQGSILTAAIKLLDRYNLTLTIDDEARVLICPQGFAFDAQTADSALPLYTDVTGLIGSPKVTPIGVNISVLLDPNIKPLGSFIVGAQTISALPDRPENQRYTARQVTHIGDTRGDDWFTEIEAVYPNLNASSAEFELRALEDATI